jgi:hypothetical protein
MMGGLVKPTAELSLVSCTVTVRSTLSSMDSSRVKRLLQHTWHGIPHLQQSYTSHPIRRKSEQILCSTVLVTQQIFLAHHYALSTRLGSEEN